MTTAATSAKSRQSKDRNTWPDMSAAKSLQPLDSFSPHAKRVQRSRTKSKVRTQVLDSKLYGGTWNQMQQQMRDVILFPSAHAQFAAKHIIHDEYSYDPTDDGPEVDVIRLINGK